MYMYLCVSTGGCCLVVACDCMPQRPLCDETTSLPPPPHCVPCAALPTPPPLRPHSLSPSHRHSLTTSRPHTVTASHPHSLSASQPHSLTASQPHTITASHPRIHVLESSAPWVLVESFNLHWEVGSTCLRHQQWLHKQLAITCKFATKLSRLVGLIHKSTRQQQKKTSGKNTGFK